MARKTRQSPRLNLRLPPDLLAWAKDYAKRNDTSVTQIIVQFLRSLQQKDFDVPQF